MAYILAQNEQKTQQILQLQSRVTQMDAPDVILVDGWGEGDPQEAQMNGLYKKQKLSTRLMEKWGEYKSINDEKEVENKNSIANRNDNQHIARPYYTKNEDDIECKLYFTPHSSEWVLIISGNVSGRSLADSGNFTKCICDSFGSNVTKLIKADFNALVVEIGQTLEQRTNHAELCNINGTLRFNKIRFEKCNGR
eukprot:895306_1